jgi:hypothetical protein
MSKSDTSINTADLEAKAVTRVAAERWDRQLAVLARHPPMSAYGQIFDAVTAWKESLEDDRDRLWRPQRLGELLPPSVLFSDEVLGIRSQLVFTLIKTGIKLHASVIVKEGPAFPVREEIARLLYTPEKTEVTGFYQEAMRRLEASNARRQIEDEREEERHSGEIENRRAPQSKSMDSVSKPHENVAPPTNSSNGADEQVVRSPASSQHNKKEHVQNAHGAENDKVGHDAKKITDSSAGTENQNREVFLDDDPADPDDSDDDRGTDEYNAAEFQDRPRRSGNEFPDNSRYSSSRISSSVISALKDKERKFSGSADEAISEYITDYTLLMSDLSVPPALQLSLFHNLFMAEARSTYMRLHALNAFKSLRDAQEAMEQEYDTAASQQRALRALRALKIQTLFDFTIPPADQELHALNALHTRINQLTAQAPPQMRDDTHRMIHMADAVRGRSWSRATLEILHVDITTYQAMYQRLRQSLQEDLAHRDARRRLSMPHSTAYYQHDVRKLTTPRYGVPYRPYRKNDPAETGNVKNNCSSCEKPYTRGHVCDFETAKKVLLKRIQRRKEKAQQLQTSQHSAPNRAHLAQVEDDTHSGTDEADSARVLAVASNDVDSSGESEDDMIYVHDAATVFVQGQAK